MRDLRGAHFLRERLSDPVPSRQSFAGWKEGRAGRALRRGWAFFAIPKDWISWARKYAPRWLHTRRPNACPARRRSSPLAARPAKVVPANHPNFANTALSIRVIRVIRGHLPFAKSRVQTSVKCNSHDGKNSPIFSPGKFAGRAGFGRCSLCVSRIFDPFRAAGIPTAKGGLVRASEHNKGKNPNRGAARPEGFLSGPGGTVQLGRPSCNFPRRREEAGGGAARPNPGVARNNFRGRFRFPALIRAIVSKPRNTLWHEFSLSMMTRQWCR